MLEETSLPQVSYSVSGFGHDPMLEEESLPPSKLLSEWWGPRPRAVGGKLVPSHVIQWLVVAMTP